MPRKASGLNEAGRLRQQRYRQRLAMKGEPEVSELDKAAAIAIAEILTLLDHRESRMSVKELINRGLTSGTAALIAKGYNKNSSIRLLNRRLTALRLGLAGGVN
ncbi:MAG: hypothetical protein KL863_05245 [Rhizobium sp.]|nr:hypothetical protein [Rhizobium sp.]